MKVASDSRLRRRIAQRGALLLPVVLACLIGSIIVRLTSGAGVAIAQEVGRVLPNAVDPTGSAASGETPESEAPTAATCPADETLSLIVDALAARERAVLEKEGRQESRLAEIATAESRLAARLAELQAAEESLSATMARTVTGAEDDLARLTAVYEAMKPKDAVPLFEAMAPDFAAGFLGRMRPDAAAALLTGMDPEKAYAISVLLAGRNAAAPRASPPIAN